METEDQKVRTFRLPSLSRPSIYHEVQCLKSWTFHACLVVMPSNLCYKQNHSIRLHYNNAESSSENTTFKHKPKFKGVGEAKQVKWMATNKLLLLLLDFDRLTPNPPPPSPATSRHLSILPSCVGEQHFLLHICPAASSKSHFVAWKITEKA